LGWLSQTMLPGYPRLEAGLNAAAPYITGIRPGEHFLNVLSWFLEAGLKNGRGHVFTGSIQAPLSDIERRTILAFFDMLWSESKQGVSQEDWAQYERITDPASTDYILNDPGYFAFFSYVMFTATVKK
ncbi:MAG: methyltransferase type 11, partial [Actinobacteria bacterium]|nr:methyltransferase type 11 [Actinomycetota bacterium]